MKKVYAIDIDGVLCEEGHYTTYMSSSPQKPAIQAVNALYDDGNVILLHTSRLEEDRPVTEAWLKRHKVKYTALVMEKLRADYYIDDKNLSIGEIL